MTRAPMHKVPVGVLALMLVVSGCTPPSSTGPTTTPTSAAPTSTAIPPPVPFTGLTQDLRMRWSAEPGIDLATGPAVIVRAYRESFILGGLMADPAFYYPGFENAVPPRNYSSWTHSVRPLVRGDHNLTTDGFEVTTSIAGTWRQHILSLTRDGVGAYIALVCSWDYGVGTLQENGRYRYYRQQRLLPEQLASDDIGSFVYRITFTPPDSISPGPAPTPQIGAAPSPRTDVFGSWKIATAFRTNGYSTPAEPANPWPKEVFERDKQTCTTNAPDPYDKRLFYVSGEHPRSDFPTLPADPGWPATGT
ncbi:MULTISPECIES: hypothetical protein [unclassified Mycobacterium]|uniref:hypothetical protein n=1 Tax=unclassified Mycobacterium TaxID=2642494 RepID=UPI001117652A|nr:MULTISPECIES: hypothetical protein [unclassified Mycobacterium]